jgi:hypothetical protein
MEVKVAWMRGNGMIVGMMVGVDGMLTSGNGMMTRGGHGTMIVGQVRHGGRTEMSM